MKNLSSMKDNEVVIVKAINRKEPLGIMSKEQFMKSVHHEFHNENNIYLYTLEQQQGLNGKETVCGEDVVIDI